MAACDSFSPMDVKVARDTLTAARVSDAALGLAGEDRGLMQRCLPIQQVDKLIELSVNKDQHYLSQHRFKGRSRKASMLAGLSCQHLDLDYYKLAPQCLQAALDSDDGAVDAVVTRCLDEGVLPPSQIVRSGRGLYVKWLFSSFVPPAAAPRWRAVQHALHARFSDHGSDPKALDSSRVLRVVGSWHASAGTPVRPIYRGPAVGFDELASSCLARERLSPADRVMTQQLRKAVAAGTGERSARMEAWSGVRAGYCAGVFFDLRRLIELRGARNEGHRERTLFWAGNFGLAAGLMQPATVIEELAEWAQLMPRPVELLQELRGGCMTTLLNRAQAVPRDLYKAKRSTLIEQLSIEDFELRELSTLGRQPATRPCEAPATRLNGSSSSKAVMDMARTGLDRPAICEATGLSRRQVDRLLKAFA
jgi:hypothetical protein